MDSNSLSEITTKLNMGFLLHDFNILMWLIYQLINYLISRLGTSHIRSIIEKRHCHDANFIIMGAQG